ARAHRLEHGVERAIDSVREFCERLCVVGVEVTAGPAGATAFQLGLEDGRIVLGPRIDLSQCTGELPGVELVPSGIELRFRLEVEPVEDAFDRLLLTQHLPVDDANGAYTLLTEVSAGEPALLVAEVGQSVVVVGAERGLSVSDQIEHTHIPLLLRQNR